MGHASLSRRRLRWKPLEKLRACAGQTMINGRSMEDGGAHDLCIAAEETGGQPALDMVIPLPGDGTAPARTPWAQATPSRNRHAAAILLSCVASPLKSLDLMAARNVGANAACRCGCDRRQRPKILTAVVGVRVFSCYTVVQ